MTWQEVSIMDQRREFVRLASQDGANRRELCRRFGVSPRTGYKWLRRAAAGEELADQSRRPHASPRRSEPAVEDGVLAVRDAHPVWGARKIRRCLEREGAASPAASTVHAILRRHGRVAPPEGSPGKPYRRFEQPAPNLMWQMDFKGHFPLTRGGSCHPLTVVDDHSRYAVCLAACRNEQGKGVQERLRAIFERYGLPEVMLVDNSSPWACGPRHPWSLLAVWLLKLGIAVRHSRPYHPQTRGKNERFHRTLKAEVLALRRFADLAEVQCAFDEWRLVYNLDRPHEALGQAVPASRYRPSSRAMPSRLPEVQYPEGDLVRRVGVTKAYVSFKNRLWKVPEAFCGERLAIRARSVDGQYGVFFGSHRVATIDLTED